jgi:hypothetical protein
MHVQALAWFSGDSVDLINLKPFGPKQSSVVRTSFMRNSGKSRELQAQAFSVSALGDTRRSNFSCSITKHVGDFARFPTLPLTTTISLCRRRRPQ